MSASQMDITAETTAKLWSRIRTVPISTTSASGDATIHATTTGLYFVVFHIFLNTSLDTNLTIYSGSTPITGAIPMAAVTDLEWITNDAPIFKGRAAGDAFKINSSATTNLRGFAAICEVL